MSLLPILRFSGDGDYFKPRNATKFLKDIFSKGWDYVTDFFKKAKADVSSESTIVSKVSDSVSWVKEKAKAAIEYVYDVGTRVVNVVKAVANRVYEAVSNTVSAVKNFFGFS
jgi:phage-related protein